MKTLALRLLPGQDLKKRIAALASEKNIEAGVVLTCVGSLKKAELRWADAKIGAPMAGPFEIVSLVGTVSTSGLHLHLSISDSRGQTLGGHLLEGNLIHTTAELVIGVLEGQKFERHHDPATGYKELKIMEGRNIAGDCQKERQKKN